ncbi:MAG: nucleotidyltransferase family protein [Candidatus Melainabacteria bacterium]|jgi:predicted nucleotidyltransferase|nr:nucleotidyltransferase family protein [Candidatus Melainabacteria bacterium]
MKTKEQVINILAHHKARLIQKWPIASLSLFGSVARGEQTETSDIDLLIDLSQPMGWDFFALADELSLLLEEKVDLIPKQGIKPRYWERIMPDVVEVLHA